MLKIEYLPPAPITSLVTSNQPPFTPNLDIRRQNFALRTTAGAQRRHIPIGSPPHAALAIDCGEAHLRQLKSLPQQRQEIFPFNRHPPPDPLLSLSNQAPLIISTP